MRKALFARTLFAAAMAASFAGVADAAAAARAASHRSTDGIAGIVGMLSSQARSARYNLAKYRDNALTVEVAAGMDKLRPAFRRRLILAAIDRANASIRFQLAEYPAIASWAAEELAPVERLVRGKPRLSGADRAAIAAKAAEAIRYLDAVDYALSFLE